MCAEKSDGRDPDPGDTTRGTVADSDSDKTIQSTVNNLTDPELILGKVLAGEYEILSHLGSGAMGAVYKAKHLKLHKYVAIKVLVSTAMADPVRRERFMREARAAAQLNHINVAGVHQIGFTENNQPFFVMDLLEGLTLEDYIEKRQLELIDFKSVFIQVAKGIHHAHSKGIIHRDIKPSNIILTTDEDGKILVKIVDFGIAVFADENGPDSNKLTRTGVIIGTPHYMSPEQIEAKPLTVSSDIYSLGCVMYEILTGNAPFSGASAHATMVLHMSAEPEPIKTSDLLMKTPDGVTDVVMRCLKKKASERYASAKDIATALENLNFLPELCEEIPFKTNKSPAPDAVSAVQKPAGDKLEMSSAKAEPGSISRPDVIEEESKKVKLKVVEDSKNTRALTNTDETNPNLSDFEKPSATAEGTKNTISQNTNAITQALSADEIRKGALDESRPNVFFKEDEDTYNKWDVLKIILLLIFAVMINPFTNDYQITFIHANEMRDDGFFVLAKMFVENWNAILSSALFRMAAWAIFVRALASVFDMMTKKK